MPHARRRKCWGFDRHAGRGEDLRPGHGATSRARFRESVALVCGDDQAGWCGGPKAPGLCPELALRVGEGRGDRLRQPRAELAVEVAELAEGLPPLTAVDLQRLGDLRA